MANPQIPANEAKAFVKGILTNDYVSFDALSVEPWEGGTAIGVTLGQVDRDEDAIFAAEGDVLAVATGDEDGDSSYAFRCELVTEDGLNVLGAGWLSLPEYTDDESDGYLTLTLYVCREEDLDKARDEIHRSFTRSILSGIDKHLKAAVELFEYGGDGLQKALSESDVVKQIMRAAAAGI